AASLPVKTRGRGHQRDGRANSHRDPLSATRAADENSGEPGTTIPVLYAPTHRFQYRAGLKPAATCAARGEPQRDCKPCDVVVTYEQVAGRRMPCSVPSAPKVSAGGMSSDTVPQL